MADLKTSWQILTAAGEPHSTIKVQNLQAVVQVGRDAWGRTGKPQPILISATISLREPFEKASTEDSVNNSNTVHYGILSKAISNAVDDFPSQQTDQTLRSLFNHIVCHLTGRALDPTASAALGEDSQSHILERTALKSLHLKLFLPKASLIGSGVGLEGTIVYTESGDAEAYSLGLKLHGLRIPTLIGVNPNERLAKQIVVTNVELDCWSAPADLYSELEEIVVKTIEESLFQTLEALAMHVGRRILGYFIIPRVAAHTEVPFRERIKICLEKPTAVTFADAPAVEILMDATNFRGQVSAVEILEILRPAAAWKTLLPFPLNGRLDLWIQENSF